MASSGDSALVAGLIAELEAHPEAVVVMAASLDNPVDFDPQAVVWNSAAPAWDHVDPALPCFPKAAPAEQLHRR